MFRGGGFLTLFIALSASVYDSAQQSVPQSPCPQVFRYEYYGGQWTGVITARDPPPSGNGQLLLKMTVAMRLPSQYAGKINLYEDSQTTAYKFLNGQPILYRVLFPLSSPLPNVVQVTFNGQVICSGRPVTGLYVTTIDLNHNFRSNGAGGRPPQSNNANRINDPFSQYNQQNYYKTTQAPQNYNYPQYQPTEAPQQNYYYEQTTQTPPQNYYYEQTAQTPQQNYYYEQTTQTPPQNYYNEQTTQQQYYSRPVERFTTTITRRPVQYQPPVVSNDIESICGRTEKSATFIHNGESTARGEWPWLVAVFHKSRRRLVGSYTTEFKCGATLITTRAVITAGHCLFAPGGARISSENIVLRVGAYDIDDPSEEKANTRSVDRVRLHDAYSEDPIENDIAVLVMNNPVVFGKYVRPACVIRDYSSAENTVGSVVGWGHQADQQLSSTVKLARVPIVSKTQCRASNAVLQRNAAANTTICAGARDGTGPCVGDSGGGLFLLRNGRWTIRGVVSIGVVDSQRTCDLTQFVVFTDVTYYIDWIESQV